MQTLILAKSITEANQYAKVLGLPRFTYRAVRDAGAIRGVRNAEVHLLSSFLARPDRFTILSVLRNARWLEVFYADLADFDLTPKPVDQGDGMGEQLTIDDLTESSPAPDALRDSRQIGTIGGTPVIEVEDPLVEKVVEAFRDMPTPDELAELIPPDRRGPLTDELYCLAYDEHEARGHDLPEPSEEEKARVEGIITKLKEDSEQTAETEPSEDPAPEAPKRRRRSRCQGCGELRFPEDPCSCDDAPTPGTAEETMTPRVGDPFADFF